MTVKSGTSNHVLMRWAGLVVIALAELTWLAIRVEVPATGPLSVFKGFPSIFLTSLAVVTVLVWARSLGTIRISPSTRPSETRYSPRRMQTPHFSMMLKCRQKL